MVSRSVIVVIHHQVATDPGRVVKMSEEGQGRQCPLCPFVTTEEDLGRHVAKFHRDPSKSPAGAQKSPISDDRGQSRMSTSSAAFQRFRVESISERSTSEDEESTPMDPRVVLKKMSYARAVQDMLNPNQQFDEELSLIHI